MNSIKVKISNLIKIQEYMNFYSTQSNEDLVESIKANGQKSPITISEKNEIIDGYRRVDAMQKLGFAEVDAVVHPDQPSLYLRMTLNQYRKKNPDDEVTELKMYFKLYPKKQGKTSKDGDKYSREEKIAAAVGHRWKDDGIIRKIEHVTKNDFEDDFLMKQIVQNNCKVEPVFEYLTKWKSIDDKNGYGYTQKLRNGEISISEVNKLIKERYHLENDYKDTLIIPEKAHSLHIDCVELGNIKKLYNTVDLIFTSIPYYILRNYDSGGNNQLGHEETPQQYCNRIARYLLAILPTLKESANIIINIGETYDNGVGYGIPQLLKSTIESITGLKYKDTLIWSKPNPKPQNETVKRPINNVEYLLWFVVYPAKAKYNLLTYSEGEKEIKISHGAKDVDKNGKVWANNISLSKPYKKIYSHLKEQEILNIIEAQTGKNHDVYKICKEGHPAIMSPVLPIIPILMTTDEGDVVLDPFAGSNVVGRMTCLLNRKALSAELSKHYYNIGCKMLGQAVDDFDRAGLDIIQQEFYVKPEENDDELSIAA